MTEPDVSAAPSTPRVIKKYPNRRLYDTHVSDYITLEAVRDMVINHVQFVVTDTKTGADITRAVLMQLIAEMEQNGEPIFSSTTLSEIIRSYGQTMQTLMSEFLEKSVHSFLGTQRQVRDYAQGLHGGQMAFQEAMWNQFFRYQSQAVQGAMTQYLEKSANVFMAMHKGLEDQSEELIKTTNEAAEDKTKRG